MSRYSQGVLAPELLNRPAARRCCLPRATILLADPLQLVQAQVAAVLDDQLEAAGGAQAVDRRRAEGRTTAPAHLARQRSAASSAIASALRLAVVPLVEGLQHDVHRAEVGRVGVEDQRPAGDADRVGHARRVAGRVVSMRAMTRSVRSTEAESGNCTLRSR